MKLHKLAVLMAFALSLSAARAEDNKVEVNVSDDGVRTETKIDTDRNEPKKKGIFRKNDGKILGLFPAPGAKRDRELDAELRSDKDLDVDADLDLNKGRSANAEVRTGSGKIDVDHDKKLEVKGDVDFDNDGVEVKGDLDRDNKVFKKGDGKVLGIDVDRDKNVEVKGDVDIDDDGVEVKGDLDKDDHKILQKGDGKILGIPVHRDHDAKVKGDVDVDHDKGVKVETKVDTDKDLVKKNDGKTLGVDLDKDRSAEIKTDVDVDRNDAQVKAKVDTEDEWVVKEGSPNARNQITRKADGSLDTDKGDGRILGIPKRGFETVAFSQLPPAVQNTIREHALGNKIAELELATKNDQQVYEVEIQREGRNQELLIATDGRLLWDTHGHWARGNAPGVEKGSKVELKSDLDKSPDRDVKTEIKVKKD